MATPNQRTRRSAITFASGVAGTAVSIAVAFLTTPLLLSWLGAEQFGAVRALADWFGHLTLFELGFAGALPPLLALALGRGGAGAAREQMAAGIRAFVLVAALAGAGGLLLTLGATRLVPVSPSLAGNLRSAALIGTIALVLYPLAPFRALAEAGQRGWIVNAGALTQALVTALLALIFARLEWGIAGQFFALALGQVLFTLVLVRDGTRQFPGIAAAVRAPPGAEAREALRRLNRPTIAANIASRVSLFSDNIVAAWVLGPAAVAPLFLTQRLIALAGQQLLGIGNASWAALAELHARGDHDTFRARLLDLTRLVAGLAVAVLVPIAAYNGHFVALWVGPIGFGGDAVTALAATNAFLLAVLGLWGWCFGGTGRIAALAPMMLASAGLNIVCSVAATRQFGLAGPLAGTTAALVLVNVWYVPRALHAHFGIAPAALARAALLPLAWGFPLGAAILWWARHHTPAGWPGLGAEMALAGAVLLACWWRFALTEAERAEMKARWAAARAST